MERYRVIGIMSGTSLDGIDVALCDLINTDQKKWSSQIINAKTFKYSKTIKDKLSNATNFSGIDLMLLSNEIGDLIGHTILNFIYEFHLEKDKIDFISSHGHTIFHQPNKKLTVQIGNGANISSITKIPVICDFRSTDLALNGNGAPLVPIGDKHLFSEYNYCLNLGGIANISFEQNSQTTAFDVCPVNIVLNKLVSELNIDFDDEGKIARAGTINTLLLDQLNNIEYYSLNPPKSIGIEWIEKEVFPVINSFNIKLPDKLCTYIEHVALQIAKVSNTANNNILVTGGGAYNSFLIERIQRVNKSILVLPQTKIIEYKEALIFAFLGVLRFRNEINCLSSVTGANENNIGGCIYRAF